LQPIKVGPSSKHASCSSTDQGVHATTSGVNRNYDSRGRVGGTIVAPPVERKGRGGRSHWRAGILSTNSTSGIAYSANSAASPPFLSTLCGAVEIVVAPALRGCGGKEQGPLARRGHSNMSRPLVRQLSGYVDVPMWQLRL
jgi:hypothetical protein